VRSASAAVFVTVYFLVSEIAAQLFEDFSGSAYLGCIDFDCMEKFLAVVALGQVAISIRPFQPAAPSVA